MIEMPWNNATAPNVMLEVTDACNVNCRVCYKKKGSSFKTLPEIERDLDAGLKLRPVHTVAVSGGEPTLHPELPDIIGLVKKRGVHVFLLTNGVGVDGAYLRILSDSGLDSVLFHVDQHQQRPDLEKTGGIPCALKRLKELVQMAAACGIDVSMSATLYEDGVKTLERIGRFFFETPEITFLYVSRGMDPRDPLPAGDRGDGEQAGSGFGAGGLAQLKTLLEREHDVEPFAFIPARESHRAVWVSYFVPVIYNGQSRYTFRIRSNAVDLWLMKMQKLISGRYVHKTTQKPGLTLFRVVVNAITTARIQELVKFLRAAAPGSARLKHKMIAYDDGPRVLEDGTIEKCEYCPTAIVRNGRLLACCTADHEPAKADGIISRTTALCTACSSSHDAAVVRKGNRVNGVVLCPKGEQTYELSSDADMYMAIGKKTATKYGKGPPPEGMRYALNYISITNACNLKCAVCGVDAKPGPESTFYLSTEEICRRARAVRQHGSRILHLFGGEPTMHPQLPAIVEQISRMGFSTGIVTNGYLLGRDGSLAMELKRRGLSRICLQFDSLSEATLDKLGRNYLVEKRKAIRNALDAGLDLGLNCTVTEHNIGEVGELLVHGLKLGPGVKNMTFASAAPVGRYELSCSDSPDRERIVKQLLTVGDRYGFSFDDVFPLPAYLPWGTQTHPDCGAHIVLVRSPGRIQPLNGLVDTGEVYRRLGKSRMRRHWISKYLIPAIYLLASARRKKLFQVLRVAAGMLARRPGYSITNIGISNYRGAMFLDEQRIERCASAFYTSAGPIKACVHFLGDQTVPGSRGREELRGKCPLTAA